MCVWTIHEGSKVHSCVIGPAEVCVCVKQLLKSVTPTCLCFSLEPKPKLFLAKVMRRVLR